MLIFRSYLTVRLLIQQFRLLLTLRLFPPLAYHSISHSISHTESRPFMDTSLLQFLRCNLILASSITFAIPNCVTASSQLSALHNTLTEHILLYSELKKLPKTGKCLVVGKCNRKHAVSQYQEYSTKLQYNTFFSQLCFSTLSCN